MNQSVCAVILLQSLNRTCRTSVSKRYEEKEEPNHLGIWVTCSLREFCQDVLANVIIALLCNFIYPIGAGQATDANECPRVRIKASKTIIKV